MIGRKELLAGLVFSLIVAIFINYPAVERILDLDKEVTLRLLRPLLFPFLWYLVVSFSCYLLFGALFGVDYHRNTRFYLLPIVLIVGGVVLCSMFMLTFDAIGEFFGSMVVSKRVQQRIISSQKGLNSSDFKHILVGVLSLFFVIVQRLLYRNQEVERRNRELQHETLRSQHSALLQQINPHFFFNSLNSLRYMIVSEARDISVEFLDNLTTIFRKSLKVSSSNLHSLSQELEITRSYLYVLECRFSGKLDVCYDISPQYEDYMIAPMTILTLVENIVKHNTISSSHPIVIRIYTVETEDVVLVVENSIHPKFECVESGGLGLRNLYELYMLLDSREVVVEKTDTLFRVSVPLISR